MEKIRTWYNKNGKYDSVLFVNYTEGSKLAKECQKIINNIGLKIKVVEKSGRNLKQELIRLKKANVKIAVKYVVTNLRLIVECEKSHMKLNVKDPIIEKNIHRMEVKHAEVLQKY